eukprot:jgi/Chlat1/1226/Chrsp115S01683
MMLAAVTSVGASVSARVVAPVAAVRVPVSARSRGGFGAGRPAACRSLQFRVLAAAADVASKEDAKPAKADAKPKAIRAKGDIVRVEEEKYANSKENYANQPLSYSGIQYIFEHRGEVLDVRQFEAGEYCLVAWAGIPNPPAWLPSSMLVKVEKMTYERQ